MKTAPKLSESIEVKCVYLLSNHNRVEGSVGCDQRCESHSDSPHPFQKRDQLRKITESRLYTFREAERAGGWLPKKVARPSARDGLMTGGGLHFSPSPARATPRRLGMLQAVTGSAPTAR